MAVSLDGSNCSRAIVAGSTVIHDTGMIEYRVTEGAGYMTQAAIFGGRDVAVIFLGQRAAGIIAMTFDTVICSASMVEGGVSEVHGVMTDTAILGRGGVRRCFPPGTCDNKIAIVA